MAQYSTTLSKNFTTGASFLSFFFLPSFLYICYAIVKFLISHIVNFYQSVNGLLRCFKASPKNKKIVPLRN